MYFFASSGFNLLEVNPGLVIWTLITFLIVVIVLKRFAWDIILTSLDQRSNKIKSDIEQAEEMKKQSQTLLKEYEDKLISMKKEYDKILSDAKEEASSLKDSMIEEAKKEVSSIKENMELEIKAAKELAIENIKKNIIEVSVEISQKFLEKELKVDRNIMIDSELKNFQLIDFK